MFNVRIRMHGSSKYTLYKRYRSLKYLQVHHKGQTEVTEEIKTIKKLGETDSANEVRSCPDFHVYQNWTLILGSLPTESIWHFEIPTYIYFKVLRLRPALLNFS